MPDTNVQADPMCLTSQLKFSPKKPVTSVSGRKIVATMVSRSWTSLV